MLLKRSLSLIGYLIVLWIGSRSSFGQAKISGTVTYNKINPLGNVSIAIENSYDGATTDEKGKFSFATEDYGEKKIIAKLIGFEDVVQTIVLKDSGVVNIEIIFTTKSQRLEEVIVKSRVFEGSDKNKVTVLNTLDILTTASDGNITTALKTLPGTQQVGESADLFVRGGTGQETKTYIDGMMVSNFNYSSPSTQASRSRFPPGLFKGTFFSSGGYSALYGQALSSTLILESQDILPRSEADITISPIMVGGGVQKVLKDKNTMVGATINYTNLTPYFSIASPTIDFSKKPEYLDITTSFRHRFKNNGMLKFYGSAGTNAVSFKKNSLDYPAAHEALGLENKNFYSNLTYKVVLKNNWKFYVGSSLSYNKDINTMKIDDTDVKGVLFDGKQENISSLFQLRTVLTANIFNRSKLHWGTEYQRTEEKQTDASVNGYTDHYGALFTEMDTYLSDNVSARIGVRSEYSSVLQKINFAPRVSVGYTFEDNSLLSASYGKFYQKPERNYLYNARTWDFTEADHYILSFQKVDSYQTIRAEAFYKKYDNLVTISPTLANGGSGYAQGIELFWRDKKNLKGFDYWVSYSLLDTKRKHLSYPNEVQPSFAATHTFSVVLKKYFEKISTNISTSYSYASGRPYYNPNRPDSEFMTDRTNDYHNLSLSVAYLPKIKNVFSVLVLTFSNVLGNNQTYGYTYSSTDFSKREAIGPVVNPFVFLGYFINFGVDRREDIINSRIQ